MDMAGHERAEASEKVNLVDIFLMVNGHITISFCVSSSPSSNNVSNKHEREKIQSGSPFTTEGNGNNEI